MEDEQTIADRIEKFTRRILGNKLRELWRSQDFKEGKNLIDQKEIDVLLLDLNLNGDDGFLLLQDVLSHPFQTIVISANTNRAMEAFSFGVIDFIAKPFSQDRLAKSFNRIEHALNPPQACEFLSVKLRGSIHLIAVTDIQYIEADHNFSTIHLKNNRKYLHQKSLQNLMLLLPFHFLRIHRSYIVNEREVKKVLIHGGGKYEVVLRQGAMTLPMSRGRYLSHKERWN